MRINNYGFLFSKPYAKEQIFNNFVNTVSNLVSDYACIKSGSYNKLISAYYDKIDNDDKKSYKTYDSAGKIVENIY